MGFAAPGKPMSAVEAGERYLAEGWGEPLTAHYLWAAAELTPARDRACGRRSAVSGT